MDQLQDTIYKLETSLLQPEVRSSRDQLSTLLSDDFKEFGSSGLVYTKQDILSRLPANIDRIVYAVSDFEIKILSKDVVMSNFKVEKNTDGEESRTFLRTSLWRKEGSDWKIFFHQGTLIK